MLNRIERRYQNGKRLATKKILTVFLLLILAVNLLAPALGLNQLRAEVDPASLLELHNIERVKLGLSPLTINPNLNTSAHQKAQAMIRTDCWSHYCPPGKSPWDFFEDAGYQYLYAGENLAEGFYENDQVIKAWMNSPTHKANIANDKFTEIGFGFARGSYQGNTSNIIVVVHFGHAAETDFVAGETDLIPPEILSPADNSYVNTKDVEIYGKVKDATNVRLYLDGDKLAEATVDASKGIFTAKYQGLEDNSHTLIAQSNAGSNNSHYSKLVTFTVDTQPDSVGSGDFTIIDNSGNQKLQLFKPGLDKVEVHIPTPTEMIKVADGSWELNFANNNIQKFSVVTTDKAGNTAQSDITLTDIDVISESSFLPNISMQSLINIFIVAALLLFLIADIYWMQKHIQKVKGQSHFHVGILVILIIVILISSSAGTILNGLNLS